MALYTKTQTFTQIPTTNDGPSKKKGTSSPAPKYDVILGIDSLNFWVGELLGAVQVLFGHQGPLPSDVFELRHLTDGGSDDCGVWMMEMVYL